ncbi:MAG: hypothetical protein WBS22_16905, partial [Methylocystis sp.]
YFYKNGFTMVCFYNNSSRKLFEEGYILDVGRSCEISINDIVEMTSLADFIKQRQFETEEWQVYVMGEIRYQDEGGADRFMGFCRLRGEDGRFRAVDDPDYEFQD